MIKINTEACHFIKIAALESYIKENLSFDDYRMVDEEVYHYGNYYVFQNVSGTYNRNTEHIKKYIEDGEFVDVAEILNYLVHTGVLPIGNYIIDTR